MNQSARNDQGGTGMTALPGRRSILVDCGDERHEIQWTGEALALTGHFGFRREDQGSAGDPCFVPGVQSRWAFQGPPLESEFLLEVRISDQAGSVEGEPPSVQNLREWDSWFSTDPLSLPMCGRIAVAWGRHDQAALPTELAAVLADIDAWLEPGGQDGGFELLAADMIGLGFAEPLQREWSRAAGDVEPDRRGRPPQPVVALGGSAEPRVAGELNKYRSARFTIELPRSWLQNVWVKGDAVRNGMAALDQPVAGSVTTVRMSMKTTFGEAHTLVVPIPASTAGGHQWHQAQLVDQLPQDLRALLRAGAEALWTSVEEGDLAEACRAAEEIGALNARLRVPTVRRGLTLSKSELIDKVRSRWDDLEAIAGDHLRASALTEAKVWNAINMLALYPRPPQALLYAAAVAGHPASDLGSPIASASSDARAVLAFSNRCRSRRLIPLADLAAHVLLPEDRFISALGELQERGLASRDSDLLLEEATLPKLREFLELRERAQRELNPDQVERWFRQHGESRKHHGKLRVGPEAEAGDLTAIAGWADEIISAIPAQLVEEEFQEAGYRTQSTDERRGGVLLQWTGEDPQRSPHLDDSHTSGTVLPGHAGTVTSLAWNPLRNILASASEDGTIRLWDPVGGACLETLRGHRGAVTRVVWSPDGDSLASTGWDNTVRVWERARERSIHILRDHAGAVDGLAWSPDGGRLASTGRDETVRLWDPASGQLVNILNDHVYSASVDWSPDGSRLISADWDCTVRVWDPQDGRCVHALEGHSSSVVCANWSPDGNFLASASPDSVRLWDPSSGECLSVFDDIGDEFNMFSSAVWSPSGENLAILSEFGMVWILVPGRRSLPSTPNEDVGEVTVVAWRPDGGCLASDGRGMTVELWDPCTGRRFHTFAGHTNTVSSVAWNTDGGLLASGGWDTTVRVWDVAGLSETQEQHQ